jgi:hypothetical protein
MSTPADSQAHRVTVDFCGEIHVVGPNESFSIGRDGDLVVDDNPYLHRLFLTISDHGDLFWLANAGSKLSATVAAVGGAMEAWLAPGAHFPLVFPLTSVRFTAGTVMYEFTLHLSDPPFSPTVGGMESIGATTMGIVRLTPDQHLLVVALAEHALRGDQGTGVTLPPSAKVAERLGWSLTRYNRKLDNVCEKLTRAGVRGLRGSVSDLASSRRARLVEYSLAVSLVSVEDLRLLPGQ